MPELRELIKSGAGVDPLKDFAEAAREERRQFADVQVTGMDMTLELTAFDCAATCTESLDAVMGWAPGRI